MSKLPWTPKETAELRDLCAAGDTDVEIAQTINGLFRTGRTPWACYLKANRLGIAIVKTVTGPEWKCWSQRRVTPPAPLAPDAEAEAGVQSGTTFAEQDAAFQAAMLNENRTPTGPSKIPGTEDPKVIGPITAGSCSSSAGWL